MKLARNVLISIILFFVLLFALIWLLSPWLVRTLAADSLAEQNIMLDSNSRVRLNLFNSTLKVQTVALHHNDQETYRLDELQLHYGIWRLFKKEIYIERIALRGMHLQVIKQGAQLRVAGVDLSSDDTHSTDNATDNATDNTTDNDNNKAEDTASDVNTEPGLIDTLSFLAPEILFEDIHVSLDNEGNTHKVSINKLALQQTAYKNQIFTSVIDFDANIDGAAIGLKADVTVNPEVSALELAFDMNAFSPAAYAYLMPEQVSKLQAAVEVALNLSLSLEGEQLSIPKASLALGLAKLDLQETSYQTSFENLDFSVPEFTAQLMLDGSAMQAQAMVNLDLASLELGLVDSPVILTQLERLATREMRVHLNDANYKIEGDKLGLEGLMVSKVNDDLPALFAMQSIAFNTMELTPERLSMDTIELGAGEAHINIDESGNLQTLFQTAAPSEAAEAPASAEEPTPPENDLSAEPEAEAAPGPRIQLRQLNLSDPLKIAIQDHSNSNVFAKTFVLTEIEAGEVDSDEVDKKTNFKVKLADEGYFKGELAGWVTPFTEKLNLDAQLKMREFSLHEVAPYLKDGLGFEVKAGQLDLDSTANVKDDSVTSQSTILMRGAEFGASKKVDEANLIGQTAIPLNVALGMLKDGDGNIELKVPVNGNVDDPSFGLQHILGLVIKKVAMSQAKKQLMNMFVPYAQVVSVALSAGSFALKVRFEDLPYSPGQIEVGEAQAEFVNQISALLKDKEDVRVRLCPVAIAADLTEAPGTTTITPEQQTQLLSLAEQRAQAFKDRLVTEGQIESARLLLCSPVIDEKKDALPRLEFGT